MKNTFLTLLSLSLLTSCSSNFDSSTNLDAENFTNYFAPSNVTIYTSTDEFKTQYKYMGLVEGENCQAKAHHAKPDDVMARTEARKKAYQLKANAIIFTGCALLPDESTAKQCIASTVCYGQAYYVEPTSPKN
ncbi:Rcs stress response system protein RcsF [Pseudocolwellia agarivorans]|uniref:Rcs stress response system protein RcsF n=1 Tax=Pseudocolwellia agarivorans TaxID=1911682 RepID=UPI000985C95E|nr:Rcs stress response system protein RcsF [Pseudocolwellia agarivorans]